MDYLTSERFLKCVRRLVVELEITDAPNDRYQESRVQMEKGTICQNMSEILN